MSRCAVDIIVSTKTSEAAESVVEALCMNKLNDTLCIPNTREMHSAELWADENFAHVTCETESGVTLLDFHGLVTSLSKERLDSVRLLGINPDEKFCREFFWIKKNFSTRVLPPHLFPEFEDNMSERQWESFMDNVKKDLRKYGVLTAIKTGAKT